jgi:hypothetical protein
MVVSGVFVYVERVQRRSARFVMNDHRQTSSVTSMLNTHFYSALRIFVSNIQNDLSISQGNNFVYKRTTYMYKNVTLTHAGLVPTLFNIKFLLMVYIYACIYIYYIYNLKSDRYPNNGQSILVDICHVVEKIHYSGN